MNILDRLRGFPAESKLTLRQFIDSRPDKKEILLYDYRMGTEFIKALTGSEQEFVYRLMDNLQRYFGMNRIAYYEKLTNGEFRLLCSIGKNDRDIGEVLPAKKLPKQLGDSTRPLIYIRNAGLNHDLYIPVFSRTKKELIRVFAMDDTELGREYSSQELEELTQVGEFFSQFIEAKVHEDSLRLNDPLTGAYSRNGFYEMRPNDFKNVTALAILDFDDFKAFNTKFGHPMADIVLKEFVKFATTRIRVAEGDRIIRWGGDEFVVLFNKVSPKQARQRLQQILKEFASTTINLGDAKVKAHVTAGLVERKSTDDQDSLVQRADDLLMSQKKVAKNKIATDFE